MTCENTLVGYIQVANETSPHGLAIEFDLDVDKNGAYITGIKIGLCQEAHKYLNQPTLIQCVNIALAALWDAAEKADGKLPVQWPTCVAAA